MTSSATRSTIGLSEGDPSDEGDAAGDADGDADGELHTSAGGEKTARALLSAVLFLTAAGTALLRGGLETRGVSAISASASPPLWLAILTTSGASTASASSAAARAASRSASSPCTSSSSSCATAAASSAAARAAASSAIWNRISAAAASAACRASPSLSASICAASAAACSGGCASSTRATEVHICFRLAAAPCASALRCAPSACRRPRKAASAESAATSAFSRSAASVGPTPAPDAALKCATYTPCTRKPPPASATGECRSSRPAELHSKAAGWSELAIQETRGASSTASAATIASRSAGPHTSRADAWVAS
mmetsp:Transcript_43056/g.143368  ORF Transcript_43056/g.143368 Transcript_43056/m.143368 type:complete len:314 (-) Transcript_43056:381-1322(-)